MLFQQPPKLMLAYTALNITVEFTTTIYTFCTMLLMLHNSTFHK
jgi:hypothetical protein